MLHTYEKGTQCTSRTKHLQFVQGELVILMSYARLSLAENKKGLNTQKKDFPACRWSGKDQSRIKVEGTEFIMETRK